MKKKSEIILRSLCSLFFVGIHIYTITLIECSPECTCVCSLNSFELHSPSSTRSSEKSKKDAQLGSCEAFEDLAADGAILRGQVTRELCLIRRRRGSVSCHRERYAPKINFGIFRIFSNRKLRKIYIRYVIICILILDI